MRVIVGCLVIGALAGCGTSTSSPTSSPSASSNGHAVVVVSGFAAQSPFTTPTQGCTSGAPAGLSDSGLRASLLKAGYQVYTSPAQIGTGQISSFTGPGAFSNCPTALPESMTVNAIAPIDEGGTKLSTFINYLNAQYGVTSVDIVAHSMGGLFSRSGIKSLKDNASAVAVRSFITIGTPWEGSFSENIASGAVPASACGNQASCLDVIEQVQKAAKTGEVKAPEQLSTKFLDGADGKSGWNQAQGDALAGIPVTLFAGNLLKLAGGDPRVWPNDGLIQETSALATGISDTVLPHRQCLVRPDVHSAFFTDALKLKTDQALTYDPVVLEGVNAALANADKALTTPNRQGCPTTTQ